MNKPKLVMRWSMSLILILAAGPVARAQSAAPASDKSAAAPAGVFNVRDFGASADGATLATAALQKAIDACAEAGGGTVYFPAGTYLSGPLFLRSFVTLHLESGATLKGSRTIGDYPIIEGRWEGIVAKHRASLVTAIDCEHVGVVGRGTIDGQGNVWWAVIKERKAAEKTASKSNGKSKKGDKAEAAEPAKPAAPAEDFPRPRLLNFIRCKNVLVQGVTLINSPAWTVHPAFCENVVVDGITINNPDDSPNTDGINPDSCVNVRIVGCLLNCGDDCVTLKSGKDEEGRRLGRPTENVTVTGCVMLAGHGGVVIGSEMSGGVRDVTVTGCVFRGTDQGIRIKSQRGRGGVVENIMVSNIAMHDIVKNGIVLTTFYSGKVGAAEPLGPGTPLFRNITISNVRVNGAQTAATIEGLEEQPIQGVVMSNIDARTSEGVKLTQARDIKLERMGVEVTKGAALITEHASEITVDDFKAVSWDKKSPGLDLRDSQDVWVRSCRAAAGVKPFLRVSGETSKRIRMGDNDLSAAEKELELKDKAPDGAVVK